MLTIGDKIPEINVIIDGNKPFKFPNRDGKNLVLYFYPKDDTPGCTKEAINFSEQTAAFETENTIILG
ncbi:MAG: redoxin domain-containing protein, partial [Planktomarina sp.]|nr:redoxin domain-containing protein [Planktomarina sp.]